MKKILVFLSALVFIPFVSFADQYTPPLSCDTFLNQEVVIDQLDEIFGQAKYTVKTLNDSKGLPYCTLTVKTSDGNSYFFTSQSHDDYLYEKSSQTISLILFQDNNPKFENVLEGTYDPETKELIDAAYDFHPHKQHPDFKGVHSKLRGKTQ